MLETLGLLLCGRVGMYNVSYFHKTSLGTYYLHQVKPFTKDEQQARIGGGKRLWDLSPFKKD